MIFVVIVGLWLVWVGPYLLRFLGTATLAEALPGQGISFDSGPVTATGSAAQGIIMENNAHSGTARAASGPARVAPEGAAREQHAPAPLNIRYGRTALALVGAGALLTFVIGGGLALFGMVSGSVPGVAMLAVAAVVLMLRMLVRRDRRRRAAARVNRAFEEAMNPPVHHLSPLPQRETVLFDAAADADAAAANASEKPEPVAAPQRLTAEELRAEALKVAAEADSKSAAASAPGSGPTWQPVEVPKPTYVASAKAERPAPAPLPAPEVKKPTAKTPIKQAAVAPKTDLPVAAKDGASPAAKEVAPQPGKINLDAVLQRRRA
ncbi:hypothetical protein AC20117_00910 [Arthrobacter crystallopoietes]|nr:hypothetical protein AC20117_00910 [Arthrobacter crystallopoietes]